MLEYYIINDLAESVITDTLEEGKNLLVILFKSDTSIENMEGLKKILTAVRLDFDRDVSLRIISDEKSVSLIGLGNQNTFPNVWIFSDKPEQVVINCPKTYYQPIVFENLKVLLAESLQTILTDQKRKVKLWKLLQKMYLK